MYVNRVFEPIQSKMYVWDSDILDWVAWEGGTSGTGPGTDVAVTNWPVSQTVDDGGVSLTIDGEVVISKTSGLSLRLDEASNTVMYIGEALPGAGESSSAWRIKKMDTSSGTSMKWAGGADTFVNRWDQRTGLSYS